jgi:hypothetical protein
MSSSSGDLTEAMGDALSPSWSVRASAGQRLAPHAGVAPAAAVLGRLLLDPENTAVTRETAEALLTQRSLPAVQLVALAVAHADDNQANWLQTAVQDVAWSSVDAEREVLAVCAVLAGSSDADVRRGAAEISEWSRE